MAFNTASLTIIGYANGFTLWHYVTNRDAKASIGSAGYFNDAGDQVRTGDFILVSAADGYGIAVVNGVGGGIVDITDATALGRDGEG